MNGALSSFACFSFPSPWMRLQPLVAAESVWPRMEATPPPYQPRLGWKSLCHVRSTVRRAFGIALSMDGPELLGSTVHRSSWTALSIELIRFHMEFWLFISKYMCVPPAPLGGCLASASISNAARTSARAVTEGGSEAWQPRGNSLRAFLKIPIPPGFGQASIPWRRPAKRGSPRKARGKLHSAP